ncbi:MAG: hypothetical protein U1E45_03675 [Geminicoccaceae bacterium]
MSATAHPEPLTRAEAARRNGALSRGPVTAEGKARSARNALKHGLAAEHVHVTAEEDAAAFEKLLHGLLAKYRPADEIARHLVERLASVMWRQKRGDRLEVQVLEEMEAGSEEEPPKLWNPALFNAVQRYQSRLDRMMFRLLDEIERHTAQSRFEAATAPAGNEPNGLRPDDRLPAGMLLDRYLAEAPPELRAELGRDLGARMDAGRTVMSVPNEPRRALGTGLTGSASARST